MAIPLFIILRDLSTNGRHIGFALLVWLHTLSALIFIIIPKVLLVHGVRKNSGNSRGKKAGTRITGVVLTEPETPIIKGVVEPQILPVNQPEVNEEDDTDGVVTA